MDKDKMAKKSLLALNWPLKISLIVILILAISLVIVGFFVNPILAFLEAIILEFILSIGIYAFISLIKQTTKYLDDLSFREDRGEQEALINIPLGMLLYSDNKEHTVQWINPKLQNYFGKKDIIGNSLAKVDSQLEQLIKQDAEHPTNIDLIKIGKSRFKATVQTDLRVIYLLDVTTYENIQKHYEEEKIAIGQIFLDNYDEVTQSMEDRDQSNLTNYVTNQLTDWAKSNSMFIKRVSEDQFIVIAYARSLAAVEQDNFAILDKIRRDTSKQNYPLTLSVGFAYGRSDLGELARDAQKNLDLALGRGGDQVVVKKADEKARFYGGNTNPMEKRTRVRARMISQALRDLFNQTADIYVMGHAQPDMDVLGACLGIHRIAQMNDKKCHIVVDRNNNHTDIERLLKLIDDDADLKADLISPAAAIEQANSDSMLIMVDTSKPSISMSTKLCQKLADHLVVIDHHRRGEEFPPNPLLVYIEPYASSACELITEMVEYQPQTRASLSKLEATAMLAGISVDTRSFTLRSGTRTFDAASYLRSVGADGTLVQNLLKENVDSYIQKSHLIDTITMITSEIALCAGQDDQVYDSVIAAQAADTLLSLNNIEAAFVITKRNDGKIAISARSLGKINVQVIMEEMGGGGHLSNAATQLAETTIADAKQQLIAIVQQKVENKSTKKTNDNS
ncbi:hypothetical protein DS832_01290 [Bombilactobacillus bombi]|uniref:Cyclic-di-AMP phosphodiesterase n=1 Tax=Bombilactobacillus bombi TaxID=1303590 RepID=A0A3R6ZAN3_9LACO|nr:DHH family phosphoesterase [Bombilactobacillus bombi]RHW48527.1 hypothetical protein DS832_01290 [Bombilactobacillus bombi]